MSGNLVDQLALGVLNVVQRGRGNGRQVPSPGSADSR